MAVRTWTDAQLREPVAGQRSWRGVLRALGLKGTSSSSIGTVRRRAKQLGLDTSHFTGHRRWSDQELKDAVAAADSWGKVAGRLGLADDPRSRARLKGYAFRAGLDVSHLKGLSTLAHPLEIRLGPPRLWRSAMRHL